ncbi:MAG: 4-alpha-glucanotransferase [Parachlamydiaceae bacterium]|nr:4-alpha-glucanotransferase [Parachlamydiaceae bacterium]
MNSIPNDSINNLIEASPLASQWQRIGIRPHHGICLPLFSLHSGQSAGIGEYPDLIPMLSWCQRIGLDTVQLLPLNDTGPNTSPYSSISAYALNPLHLGLAHLQGLHEDTRLQTSLKEIQKLTSSPRVNYEAVQTAREYFLKDYFQFHSKNILESSVYQQFQAENPWLQGYALFKSIKSHCHWHSWGSWPEEIRNRDPKKMEELHQKFEMDIKYHTFVQFLCFQQMKEVKACADKLGVYLKGDLPILLDRESADLWLNSSLFHFDLGAGAPPDAFSNIGQNWGFPLYNWDEMEKQNYSWWKERLAIASNFYHIYRIDHIVGFFRIWAIPHGEEASEGHYIPPDLIQALQQGRKILSMMLDATDMLPIGEDLGTVPPEVRNVMKELGICGTNVMRWEREYTKDGCFILPNEYPPLSVTTVSTHDSSTLQLWWKESANEALDYCKFAGWEYHPTLSPEYQFALLYTSHHTSGLFHINLLQEYLAFFPELVHTSLEEERINTPGIISDLNWSYRILPTVEMLTSNPDLSSLICALKA